MIVFNIIIWSIVSAVWAALGLVEVIGRHKDLASASASAACVVIVYLVEWWAS